MKIENITKLILKFIGGGTIKFPTCFLKWIIVEPCDGDGGDTPSSMNLDDFRNFSITLITSDYRGAYDIGNIMPINSFFDVSSMDIFKGLSILSNNVENPPEITFDVTQYDGTGGSYRHRIYITPNGEDYQINVTTDYSYTDEETGNAYNFNYDAQFIVDVDNETLQVVSVSKNGE